MTQKVFRRVADIQAEHQRLERLLELANPDSGIFQETLDEYLNEEHDWQISTTADNSRLLSGPLLRRLQLFLFLSRAEAMIILNANGWRRMINPHGSGYIWIRQQPHP